MGYFKYITKCVLWLVFLFLLNQQLRAFSGKYPIQNFTPADYRAGIQNIDFAQNRDMNLFVANNLGVLSYNGYEWEMHVCEPGKKERSLAFDENTNRLYVGSQGTFGYLDDNWNYVSLVDKIPAQSQDFDEVWDVFLFNSSVYFCTFQHIYIYDGQSISVAGLEGGTGRSFQAGGKLFTQNQQGKLFEIKDKNLVVAYPQSQNDQIIAGIVPEGEGLLLFYHSGDIELTTPFGVSRKHGALARELKGKYINHVLQLSDARLAISTQTAGLFLYDLQTQNIEQITAHDGLLTNACLRGFQDYAGNLWIGMQNGIAIIDINSPMRYINQEAGIEGSGYEVFHAEEGIYYTTSNGIYFQENDTAHGVFLQGTEGPAYGMQKIMGRLYAGHHTGLFVLENGKAERLANTDGLWQVKQLKSNPAFAIGGTYAGLYLFRVSEYEGLQAVQKISGFDESSRFFEEDQKGQIWVGQFYKGLYRLDLSPEMTVATVTNVSNEHDLPIDEQIVLSKINNELYLATKDGIYMIDQTTDRIREADIFSQDIGKQQVYLLAQDKQKNIHVFAENLVGFFKQISSSNLVFVPSSLFQLRYTFNNDLLNVSTNTTSGVLFNANEGFIHYFPEMESRLASDIPVLVRKVSSVSEDSVLYLRKPFATAPEQIKQLIVPHRAKVLQFVAESFQFNNVSNQQFRFFLQGFDDKFGEWSNTAVKEYSNLTEGEYEFWVQARNHLGEIVTSQPLSLKVEPPFHRSTSAKILYALSGVFLLLLVSDLQKRRYHKKAEKAEEAIQIELTNKQKELIKIEQQKAQELRQLEEDKVKSELQHLNNLLAASTMNLVVKNEFIDTIREKIKEVTRKGKNKETKQALEQLVKEIDTTLRLQEDWEQFQLHFDQVHGSFLTRLRNQFPDLSPNEQKLCAFLRLNLNTKDIANLMGISLRGVEVARYRLRKKLDLDKGQNLSKFILEY